MKFKVTTQLRKWLVDGGHIPATLQDDEAISKTVGDLVMSGDLSIPLYRELTASPNPSEVLGGGNGDTSISYVEPSKRYGTTKRVGKHVRTGLPVRDEHGRDVELPSEQEHAKAGVFLKHLAGRAGMPVTLTDHERSLLGEIFTRDAWCGKLNNEWQERIPGSQAKALLDDTTSGGLEVTPIWFDNLLVSFPLLHAELFPLIDLRPVPRGSRVEGASIGNPTVIWGTGEGTSIALFDTASMVSAIDTTIHPVTCAIEVGRDLLNDSPASVGAVLVENIGQRMMSELDRVIVIGNGTTEPEGIINASSVTDNPWGSDAATVADYEGLMFGIGKQYRNPSMRPVFFSNDTSYQRARGIAVSTADQRRVFGMSHNDYMLLQHPYKIANDMQNTEVGFGAMAKYRMYRRQGSEVRFEQGGKELALRNLNLLVVRGRYGGRVVDPNAFAITDDAAA